MKKIEIIEQANKDHNPAWELVHILEKLGQVKTTTSVRLPAVYISETQMLLNLSKYEALIVERESAYGNIIDFRLIKYDQDNIHTEGAYVPSKK